MHMGRKEKKREEGERLREMRGEGGVADRFRGLSHFFCFSSIS